MELAEQQTKVALEEPVDIVVTTAPATRWT